MIHDTTSHGIARGTSLVRRVGGIELPVAGMWNVPGNYATISFAVPQFLRRPTDLCGRAREATLVFSDDPGEVLVAVLFDAPGLDIAGSTACREPVHLEARSIRGPHRWALAGEVFPGGTGVVPLRATLDYHGVWRRGDRAYGWFVLAGTIGRHVDAKRRLRFNFDLLAYGPAGARPELAPARSLSLRVASQTRDAA